MPRPTMDRDRLGALADGWEPGQRFARDDINALLEMVDTRDERIAELEAQVDRATKSRASVDRIHGQCDERIRGLETQLAADAAETARITAVKERIQRAAGVVVNLLTELP